MHRPIALRLPLSHPFGMPPILFGTLCCVVAAIAYTGVNICLRKLSVLGDPVLTLFVKETIAVLLVGPWLLGQALRGKGAWPGGRSLETLVLLGLVTHLAGNLPLIWAMRIVGLTITIPVSLGVNLVTCAVLGRWLLREKVSSQTAWALAVLVVSVVLLSLGAGQTSQAESGASAAGAEPFWVGLAVGASCLAGLAYGVLAIGIRRTATAGVPVAVIALMIPAVGSLSLGPVCLARHGLAVLASLPTEDLLVMLVCGALNIFAFVAIIKGLQITTAVHANVINASQVAMSAIAGLLYFQEAATPSFLVGIALTVAGTVLIDRPLPP